MPRREYFHLDSYVSGVEGDDSILKATSTKLKGNCGGRDCLEIDAVGPLNLEEEKWQSDCPDRMRINLMDYLLLW